MLELVAQAREWGEERVYYRDPTGRMRFLPARWTSMAAPDPFVLMAADRAYFRLEDLIRLQGRLKELEASLSSITPGRCRALRRPSSSICGVPTRQAGGATATSGTTRYMYISNFKYTQ
jgi:hypothetical protein